MCRCELLDLFTYICIVLSHWKGNILKFVFSRNHLSIAEGTVSIAYRGRDKNAFSFETFSVAFKWSVATIILSNIFNFFATIINDNNLSNFLMMSLREWNADKILKAFVVIWIILVPLQLMRQIIYCVICNVLIYNFVTIISHAMYNFYLMVM